MRIENWGKKWPGAMTINGRHWFLCDWRIICVMAFRTKPKSLVKKMENSWRKTLRCTANPPLSILRIFGNGKEERRKKVFRVFLVHWLWCSYVGMNLLIIAPRLQRAWRLGLAVKLWFLDFLGERGGFFLCVCVCVYFYSRPAEQIGAVYLTCQVA